MFPFFSDIVDLIFDSLVEGFLADGIRLQNFVQILFVVILWELPLVVSLVDVQYLVQG